MKVTVFGGTGAIGQEVVEELLFRGYAVTVFLPESVSAPPTWGDTVQVETGAITDAAAVDAVVAGSVAVINALDPRLRPRDRDLLEGTGNIVAAMHRHRIGRYIGHGIPAVTLCPKEQPTIGIRFHRFLARRFDARAFKQMVGMLQVVTDSEVDWTIVRFLHLGRGPGRGLRYVGYFAPGAVGASATADIAGFTVSQILDTDYICDAPAISN